MFLTTYFTFLSALIAVSQAQQACNSTTETHPSLTWSKCTATSCTEVQGAVVVDSNWRWTHKVDGSTNCYTGNKWDTSICSDGETCAESCCVDGADYGGTYGVTTSGGQLSINFVTKGAYSTNIGSRLYLLEDDDTYQMFTLLGNEFTFDVDVSAISCGLNGALYFVSMDEDGGLSKYAGNKAGAKYGTGYCDAQCARDVKFINGVANVEDWEPSSSDANSGIGKLGTCCPEMDIWEANGISTAYTAHPCKTLTQHSCEGDDCGGTYSDTRYAGDCDPDGCDFNPYRQGNESFYGPGSEFTIDTTKKITVVTQFIEGRSGSLSQIKRFYVQDDKVVANSQTQISGTSGNSIDEEFCTAQKVTFSDKDDFATKGGFSRMSDAIASPMVLVMSLWDDHHSNMLWLDSTYPANSTAAGSKRGTCSTDSGVPATVESETPNASVVFSNIKFGPIGSTFESSSSETSDDTSSQATTSAHSSPTTAKAISTKSEILSTSSIVASSVSSVQSAVQQKSTSTSAAVATIVTSIKAEPERVTSDTTSTPSAQSSTKGSISSASLVQTTAKAVSASDAATTPTESTSADDEDCDDSGDADTEGSVHVAAQYYQCGGINWTGATTCATGYTCREQNPYYYQCV